MDAWWFWLPVIGSAFLVREYVRRSAGPKICPHCGSSHVRHRSRRRLAFAGAVLMMWADASKGWYWLLLPLGWVMLAASTSDEASLRCETCRAGFPIGAPTAHADPSDGGTAR